MQDFVRWLHLTKVRADSSECLTGKTTLTERVVLFFFILNELTGPPLAGLGADLPGCPPCQPGLNCEFSCPPPEPMLPPGLGAELCGLPGAPG